MALVAACGGGGSAGLPGASSSGLIPVETARDSALAVTKAAAVVADAVVKCVTQANSAAASPAKSLSFTLACTPNAGDALIAVASAVGVSAPASSGSVSADVPAGFTQLGSEKYSGAIGQSTLATKIAVGNETTISVSDPVGHPFRWAVTVYDVENPGTITASAVTTASLSPATGSIAPTVAGSLAIGVWTIQDSASGLPVSPAFAPPSGWVAASAAPPFTSVATMTNNLLQDSASTTLTATTAFTATATFSAAANLASSAGDAQMIVIAPGAPTVTATPTPTPSPTPSPSGSPSPSPSPSPTVTATAPPTAKPSPTATPHATPTPTATPHATPTPTPAPTATPGMTVRRGFLGAFFRAVGSPAYGVFSASATDVAPSPYPTPGTTLFGSSGYCDAVAKNGVSISSGMPVDATKLADIVNLGVKWTRSTLLPEFIDQSHIFGAGAYSYQTLDSSQCALLRNNISPIIELDAGPVMYDATPGKYSPVQVPTYESAADFGQYCGVVAAHERATTGVSRYTMPGNEVNSDPTTFPGGATQIAAYAKACYAAIKAAQPNAFVYGLELNMVYNINAPGFVQQLVALGCKYGTCYDGIDIHLYLPYPIPPNTTPCFPAANGNYDYQCVTAIRTAAGQPNLHILIGETAYMVPATVPSEAVKATAVVAEMKMFAADPNIDGVNYANVDECALYPSGEFEGGCLISTAGVKLPAYTALQALAEQYF